MIWHRFPILTFRIFLTLEAPLRLLDLEEVEGQTSSEGLECRRCSMSSLALFGVLSDKESLRARFFSPSVLCCANSCAHLFHEEFTEGPPDV